MSFYHLFPDRYKIVDEGKSTCKSITDKTQCEEATRQLGIFSSAQESVANIFPPYCYMRSGVLYFNKWNESKKKCGEKYGGGGLACVCKKGNVDHQIIKDPDASSHRNKCAISVAAIPLQLAAFPLPTGWLMWS